MNTNNINEKLNNDKLDEALFLSQEMKWSVIPVGLDKKPLISWKEFQSRIATVEEIQWWFLTYPEANLGVVTGKISGITVVDIDPRHGGTENALGEVDTVKVKTGGGGWHYYFLYNSDVTSTAGVLDGVDIRSEGGYIVVPPSKHQSGNLYEWIKRPSKENRLQPLPNIIINATSKGIHVQGAKLGGIVNGVREGTRNNSATSFIGSLVARFKKEEWESIVWPLVVSWNNNNKPPLESEVLKTTFENICKREATKKSEEDENRRTVADRLVDLTLDSNAELYTDQLGESHISFPEKSLVGYPIKSSTFRKWLAGKYWSLTKKGFSGDTFATVVCSLEGLTAHNGDTKYLYNRVAHIDEEVYYNLSDDRNVVRITPKGWEITQLCPIKFRRFSHQLVQVMPERGGDLRSILKYINLKSEIDKLLFLTYLPTVLMHDYPRVILINIGDQGSAKSTALKVVRSLVDPSVSELLSPPSDTSELAQAANHHYCLYLDNLTYLKDEQSDALCRLATGIGFSKRKLFTDDEDILFTGKTAVGITGINLVAQKADLLDRCLILKFERIEDDCRLSEAEFWDSFNKEKPPLLGAVFDALSTALKESKNIKLKKYPRMADYAKFAAATAVYLGKTPDEFINAFNENIGRQNEAAVESSPTAQAILKLMESRSQWAGLSSDLYKVLKNYVEDAHLQIGGAEGFPKSSNWLWKRIMQVRPNLLSLGLNTTKTESLSGSTITITKTGISKPNGGMAAMAVDSSPMEVEKMTLDDAVSLFNQDDIYNTTSESLGLGGPKS